VNNYYGIGGGASGGGRRGGGGFSGECNFVSQYTILPPPPLHICTAAGSDTKEHL